jgi:hypothetical protein
MCHEMHRIHETLTTHRHCGRQFLTIKEQIERLKEYKKWLEKEAEGVEEAIQQLKKAS